MSGLVVKRVDRYVVLSEVWKKNRAGELVTLLAI